MSDMFFVITPISDSYICHDVIEATDIFAAKDLADEMFGDWPVAVRRAQDLGFSNEEVEYARDNYEAYVLVRSESGRGRANGAKVTFSNYDESNGLDIDSLGRAALIAYALKSWPARQGRTQPDGAIIAKGFAGPVHMRKLARGRVNVTIWFGE